MYEHDLRTKLTESEILKDHHKPGCITFGTGFKTAIIGFSVGRNIYIEINGF